jgi:nicotinate phosphoribosyltransferase
MAAFESFARSRPEGLVLLLDTYDTEAAAKKVVALAPRLKASGITIQSVRIDSGNLTKLANSVRKILDDGGLRAVTIFASGGLDEDALTAFTKSRAPIDGFGVGTSLTTSSDVPAIDCVYKLQEYAGLPRRKLSEKKATWPGRKQVWRRYGPDGRMQADIVTLDAAGPSAPASERPGAGEPLIHQVMRGGNRLQPPETLFAIRERAKRELARLPEPLRRLDAKATYPVEVSKELKALAAEVDKRIGLNRR